MPARLLQIQAAWIREDKVTLLMKTTSLFPKLFAALVLLTISLCLQSPLTIFANEYDPSAPDVPAITGNARSGGVVFIPLTTKLNNAAAASPKGCSPKIAAQRSASPAKETEVLQALNEERVAKGLAPLQAVTELTQAARLHSNDMAANNVFSHTGSDGSSAGDRAQDACYQWVAVGEIIASGFHGNVENVIQAWMDSEGHRKVILNGNYTEFGAGMAQSKASTDYWTVDFGRREWMGNANFATVAPEEMPYTCSYDWEGEEGRISIEIHSLEPCQQE